MDNYLIFLIYIVGLFISISFLAYKRKATDDIFTNGELCCIFWFFVVLWFFAKFSFSLPRIAGERIATRKEIRLRKSLSRLE